jgi:hypothetical protein
MDEISSYINVQLHKIVWKYIRKCGVANLVLFSKVLLLSTEPILLPTNCWYRWHVNKLYHKSTYKRLPEDEPSGLEHVEDIVKIKILFN